MRNLKNNFTSLLLLIVLICINSIVCSQSSQKIKYKEIKPFLESKNYDEALPKLKVYYEQNIVNGAWSNKAILMEMNNMLDASKNISIIYYEKSIGQNSSSYTDSAIYWLNIMIKDDHPEKDDAIYKITELNKIKNKWVAAEKEEDRAKQQRLIEARNKQKLDSLDLIKKLEKEKLNKLQEKYIAENVGINDPMLVAKKFATAYINSDMETMLKLGYNDTVSGNIVGFKQKNLEAYSQDKQKFIQLLKDEVIKRKPNLRLTEDYNINDYKKPTEYDKGDPIEKPLIETRYIDENHVKISNIMTYDGSNGALYHGDMKLVKFKGKWLVEKVSF
jgi:hypothetical protein